MAKKWRIPMIVGGLVAVLAVAGLLTQQGLTNAEPSPAEPAPEAGDATASGSARKPKLKIGTADFPPFRIADGKSPVTGVDHDIVHLVLTNLGYDYELIVAPFKRTYANGAKGQLDAIYSFTKSDERARDYIFSDGFNVVKDVLFKRKGDDFTWNDMSDLKGRRVGASSGYNYPAPFMEAVEKKYFEVDMVSGAIPEEQHMAKLLKKRIDLFVCEVSVCSWIIKINPDYAGIDYIDKAVGPIRPFRIGFPKVLPGSEKLRQEFNRELAKIQKAGLDRPIFKKYGLKKSF